jgi:hypothetical protein
MNGVAARVWRGQQVEHVHRADVVLVLVQDALDPAEPQQLEEPLPGPKPAVLGG